MLLYIWGIYSLPLHCLNEFPVSVLTLAVTTWPLTGTASVAAHLQLQENLGTGARDFTSQVKGLVKPVL